MARSCGFITGRKEIFALNARNHGSAIAGICDEFLEKALEAAGGAGFYRETGLERLLRDAHAAQFHPLSAKRQHRFTGRIALGLDPIADAA